MMKTYEAGSKVTFIAQERTEFNSGKVRPGDKAIVTLSVDWNEEDGLGEDGPWGYGGYTSETLKRIASEIELETSFSVEEFVCGDSIPEDFEDRQAVINHIADIIAELDPEVYEPDFVIFDIGVEIFGRFHSLKNAADAIKKSNPNWWATVPSIESTDEEMYGNIEFRG